MSGGSSYKSIICTTTVQALPFIPDVFLHKRTFHKTWKEILMLECPTVAIKSIVPFLIFWSKIFNNCFGEYFWLGGSYFPLWRKRIGNNGAFCLCKTSSISIGQGSIAWVFTEVLARFLFNNDRGGQIGQILGFLNVRDWPLSLPTPGNPQRFTSNWQKKRELSNPARPSSRLCMSDPRHRPQDRAASLQSIDPQSISNNASKPPCTLAMSGRRNRFFGTSASPYQGSIASCHLASVISSLWAGSKPQKRNGKVESSGGKPWPTQQFSPSWLTWFQNQNPRESYPWIQNSILGSGSGTACTSPGIFRSARTS